MGKKSVVTLILLLATAGIVAALELSNTTHIFHSPEVNNDENINYTPATDEQKNAAGNIDKDQEDGQDKQNSTSPNSNTGKQSVAVLITTWAARDGNLTVNGRVDGIVESGGTCTLTLTKDGVKKSASRPAEPNVSDTTCGQSAIPLTSLSPGTWQAVLSYSSSTSHGLSNSTDVEVPDDE